MEMQPDRNVRPTKKMLARLTIVPNLRVSDQHILKPAVAAQDLASERIRQGDRKKWTGSNQRVKFAVFPAGVDPLAG